MKFYARKLLKARFIITTLLLISNLFLQGQTPPPREYQLKAVFLFNFTQFVEWPPNTFSDPERPLVIGVLGKNPFGNYLNEAVVNEKVNNHPLVVHYYNSIEEVKTCHILFINLSEANKLEQAVTSLKERSILTVSDSPDFPKQGGMIRFYTSNNKIKLQINLEASKAANLVLSSKLLRLAEIFSPPENN